MIGTVMTDEQLVRECRRGEDRAWGELRRKFAGLVRWVLGYEEWGLGTEDVEDLVQEVFVKLVVAIDGFDRRCSLKTFVLAITKQVAVDDLRRRTAEKRGRGRETASLDDPGLSAVVRETPAPEPEPAQVAARGELVTNARHALAGMDERCRTVIVMYYFRGMRYHEMAHALETTVNTVASWLSRCLSRLGRRVRDDYGAAAADSVLDCL